ncbi:hypothetical protein GDO81_026572 [Engystomops pustulosus]|uniref:Uncharacterized protein n=1 Tax=Engystomops pustulosus TaxID=76066 RepID=A0AAV6ZND3_ENGPU|nr:hypothetical protein GDO81_026572 [Engystomops pustulosus]
MRVNFSNAYIYIHIAKVQPWPPQSNVIFFFLRVNQVICFLETRIPKQNVEFFEGPQIRSIMVDVLGGSLEDHHLHRLKNQVN